MEDDFVCLCGEATEGEGSSGGMELCGLGGGQAEEEGMLSFEAQPVTDCCGFEGAQDLKGLRGGEGGREGFVENI